MKKNYRFLFSCILAALIGVMPLLTFSQEEESEETTLTRKEKRQQFDKFFFVNLNAGAMLNHTDIFLNKFVPSPNHWRLGYGGMFGWQFHPVFGVRGQISAGKLYGERIEAWWLAPYEEVYYKANIFDYHLDLIINFSNLISGYNPDRLVDIYGVGGIGQAQWKTEAFNAANDELIRQNGYDPATQQPGGPGTEKGFDTRTMVMEWPAGLGAAFHVAPKLDITLEAQLRFVDSDRLDNFKNGNMMIYRDMYSYTSLGLTYKFGRTDPLKKMTKEFDNVVFKAEPDPLEAHGGKVPVKITGTFPKDYFHPNAAMYITPVLKCDDGSVTELEPILLKGSSVSGPGIVIPQSGGSFTYETVMDYEDGMKACDLVVESIAFVPKNGIPDGMTKDGIQEFKYVRLPDRKIADGILYTPARFAFKNTGLFAPHGYEKVTILSKEAKLYFIVNRHDLNWNVPLNKVPENRARLNELYDHMKLGYAIKDINIDGWASPEGEETFNQGLSARRAKTANDYLVDEIRKLIRAKGSLLTIKDAAKDIQYNVAHHGPDWNGFLYHVQNSDIKDRNIILNVINSAGTPAKKEQEIRNMVVIYPELEEILTRLRRAEIVVNGYEPKKADEEIATLATSDPRQLDEKELLYSATLTEDKNTKLDIYKSAINIFPESYKGYANAGVVEIELGDLNAAKAHLEKAASLNPNNGEVHNNLGVIYALQGDLVKADEHFTKASQLGTDEKYNLGIMAIHKGDYSKAINLFGNTTCDYNVALAYIASKNYPPAEKQLECAEKDAQTHYLMAILGARTNNTSMLFENLGKAIGMNPAYKAEAKIDREFIQYFSDPNFTSLVN
ncbi:MAG: tetratricopeptide repeat protein [Bacteroidales bacterium]|nr:tetratricopeptide repeat protein [Bacteroidales bacterium]